MTRNERALKIAEYTEFKSSKTLEYGCEWVWFVSPLYKENQYLLDDLVQLFSTFDGLMPIVCEIWQKRKSDFDLTIRIDDKLMEVRVVENLVNKKRFPYTDPESLIDALQEAIIFYYENRQA